MTHIRMALWALAAAFAPLAPAFAADTAIKIDSAWARPPLTTNGAAAAFVTLENTGAATDRLIGVKSGAAKRVMLHTSIIENGIAKMNHVAGFDVAPGVTLKMGPGGNHIMLMGVAPGVKQGATFPLTLVFEKAGEVPVEVEVLSAQAMGPRSMPGMQAGHQNMAQGQHMQGMDKDMNKGMGSMRQGHMHGAMMDEVRANLDTSTTKLTAHKLFRVTMTHDHPIALNEMHGCTLRITTPDGKPVENAEVKVNGGMPAHGHGLPTAPRVTAYLGNGEYQVEGMKFNMTGWWELNFDIGAKDAEDTATFNLVLK